MAITDQELVPDKAWLQTAKSLVIALKKGTLLPTPDYKPWPWKQDLTPTPVGLSL